MPMFHKKFAAGPERQITSREKVLVGIWAPFPMMNPRLEFMPAKREKYGFTLIELLIVVAIIAVLAAIAVPNFLEAQTRAKVSRCKADLKTIATAFEAYVL